MGENSDMNQLKGMLRWSLQQQRQDQQQQQQQQEQQPNEGNETAEEHPLDAPPTKYRGIVANVSARGFISLMSKRRQRFRGVPRRPPGVVPDPGSRGRSSRLKQRRAFLREAIAHMQSAPTAADIAKKHLSDLDIATRSIGEASSMNNQEQEEVVERATVALEELCDQCADIDQANDMIPLGGFPVLERSLDANDSALQAGSFQLLGTLVQNNPRCQQHALEMNLLEKCLHHLDHSCSAQVRVKAMYATSCLVKDYDPAQIAFAEQDGFAILGRSLKSNNEKLTTKASFLVTNMVAHSTKNAEYIIEHGILAQLLSLLSSSRTQSLEHVARTVCRLTELHAPCLAEATRQRSVLTPMLEETIAALKAREDDLYKDEIDHIEQLIMTIS